MTADANNQPEIVFLSGLRPTLDRLGIPFKKRKEILRLIVKQ
ncbi:hypothetical protein QT971_16865 [Microcoleus sp. herbarium19]